MSTTDDSKRCRWPECDCYSPQGPQACRKALTLRTPTGFTASELLIAADLAVPWAGRRHEWC